MTLPRSILLPLDLDDLAAMVLDYAVELAASFHAQLHVVHAVPPPLIGAEVPSALSQASVDEIAAHARARLDTMLAAHHAAGHLASITVEIGDAQGVILAAAGRCKADWIVMATHGRRGVSRLVLGSIAEQIARQAPCPVLLVRQQHPAVTSP